MQRAFFLIILIFIDLVIESFFSFGNYFKNKFLELIKAESITSIIELFYCVFVDESQGIFW